MGRASLGRNENQKPKAKTIARENSEGSFCIDNTFKSSDNTQQPTDAGLSSYGQDFDFANSQPWNGMNFTSDLSGSPNFASYFDTNAHSHEGNTRSQITIPDADNIDFSVPFPNHAKLTSDCMDLDGAPSELQQLSSDILSSSNEVSDPIGSIAHQGTSCVELASSTLQSLSLPSSMCASTTHPTALHTVEQVLATSRSAVSTFNTILQCPCSHSNSFTLTLALMISKILDCYSALCHCSTFTRTSSTSSMTTTSSTGRKTPSTGGLNTPPASTTSSIDLSPTSTSASSSLPRGPHNIVLDTPMAIGGCKIDPDDEYVFILQLLLGELRKVSRMVDAFAVQYSTAKEDSVYKSLEQFLRCHIHKAKAEVDAVLRRSEEGA